MLPLESWQIHQAGSHKTFAKARGTFPYCRKVRQKGRLLLRCPLPSCTFSVWRVWGRVLIAFHSCCRKGLTTKQAVCVHLEQGLTAAIMACLGQGNEEGESRVEGCGQVSKQGVDPTGFFRLQG